MCLYPKEEIRFAQEPILCVKIIGKEKKYLFGLLNFWRSPIREIDKNRKYNKELIACGKLHRELDENDQTVINTGFHLLSYSSKEKLHSIFSDSWLERCLRPAIIPKGAEYCIGQNYDIVANKIIVFDNEEQREKYLKR